MKEENTKLKILIEALKLFSIDGYEAVSVDQIAKAVGIKAPSLYKHYKSKREIFDSIVEHVNRMYEEKVNELQIPKGKMEDIAKSYKQTSIEKIKKYSIEMFLYWTEDEFSASFRKMLTLEQYRDIEMSKLYQKYFVRGPIEYMSEIFGIMTNLKEKGKLLAIEFYSPFYLMYSIYDETKNKKIILSDIEKHINCFSKELINNIK